MGTSLKALYLRNHNPASPVIRARFWSDWSHCGIVTPDHTLIEASFWHGVREVELDEVLAKASKWAMTWIECPHPAAGIDWGRTQIGKSYDLLGALGIGFNRQWEDPTKWFCSELLEAMVLAAGRRRFREDTYRIDPQRSWSVL